MTAIAQLLSKSNEHPTPPAVVEPARRLLGGFDLDPASTPEFNQSIQAEHIFTREDDGLSRHWFGRVFLNPPGGRLRRVRDDSGEGLPDLWVPVRGGAAESSMRVWWDKLAAEWSEGRVESALFVGFTLEILRTSQRGPIPVQMFPRCYPRERLAFSGDDPTHANVLVWLPPRGATRLAETMREHFGHLGLCEVGT